MGDDKADTTAARLRQLLGVGRRELLTMEEVARDYQYPSAEAARKALHRHLASCLLHRGRRLLIDRRDLDAYLARKKG
jgi:hypothetical protein